MTAGFALLPFRLLARMKVSSPQEPVVLLDLRFVLLYP